MIWTASICDPISQQQLPFQDIFSALISKIAKSTTYMITNHHLPSHQPVRIPLKGPPAVRNLETFVMVRGLMIGTSMLR